MPENKDSYKIAKDYFSSIRSKRRGRIRIVYSSFLKIYLVLLVDKGTIIDPSTLGVVEFSRVGRLSPISPYL